MKKILFLLIILILVPYSFVAADLTGRLGGKILLQVEENGEAWYVNPESGLRHYMGRPADAFSLMRKLGLGIRHDELAGYLTGSFPARLSGRIMLDVETNGEAYYIYPDDLRGYYLGRPADAFRIMRELGLGITNNDLGEIDKKDTDSGEYHESKEESPEQTGSTVGTLSGLASELDNLLAGKNLIGPDHYARLKADIETLESQGKNVNEYWQELLAIKNYQFNYYDNCSTTVSLAGPCGLDGELDARITYGMPIESGVSARIENDIADYAELGVDTSGLEDKLATILAFVIATSTEDTATSTESITPEPKFAYPTCQDQQYTVSVIDRLLISEILPLGNFNPPGHTLPTSHMYYHTTWTDGTYTERNVADLRAPGDMYITNISYIYTEPEATREYGMEFRLCDEVGGHFGHVKSLSAEVIEAMNAVECDDWQNNAENMCFREMNYFVPAGTILGTVGGGEHGGVDFGTYDTRVTLEFANPERDWGMTVHKVCHLDYYENSLKTQLYAKLNRSGEPRCGEIMQDIPGTLQGSWFHGDTDETVSWDGYLTFAYNNTDNTVPYIVIGGTFTDSGVWVPYDPGPTTDTWNKTFSEVTPDNNIYCYTSEPENKEYVYVPPGRMIVQLLNNMTVMIEHQDGQCDGDYAFESPYIYRR